MSYNKFYKYFASNQVYSNGIQAFNTVNTLGESIYKYSSNIECRTTYSVFRNKYTILNLQILECPEEIMKIQAYLNFHKDKINIVNVRNLNPKLLKIYSNIFSDSSNKLFEK